MVVGRGVIQLLIYVDLFLASLLAVGGVSALTYGQVLYLLPISLFGMAVAAAELPELARLGKAGASAIRERLARRDGAHHLLRRHHGGALRVRRRRHRRPAPPAGRVHRRRHAARLDVVAVFALGLLGTTRSRLLQNGLYALDRPKLVARIAVFRVALAGLLGAFFMFPLDRFADRGRVRHPDRGDGLPPLPDSLRLVAGRPAAARRRGAGAGRGSVVVGRVPAPQGRPRWRIGRMPRMGHGARWCLIAATACGVLAAGLRSRTDDLPQLVAAAAVCVPTIAAYLVITTAMQVPEATHLVGRLRRRRRGRHASTALGSAPCSRHSSAGGSTSAPRSNSSFNEKADPKVQLEQAITEAQDQHRRLKEQAANVIANQKQTEMRLNRAMDELEKVTANARQAVLMADEAAKTGDTDKAAEYTSAAEAFANRLIALEGEIEELKTLALQSTQASDQAKAAVQQNSAALQKKLSERQKLLVQLDQAKMQEQMNKAMASLSETVGEDVPTFDEVRDKIEARYAKAKGMSELTERRSEPHARDRAGRRQHRGPGPPGRDPRPARARPRGRRGRRRRRASRAGRPRPAPAPATAPRAPAGVDARYGQHDEVVAVDDLGGVPSGRSVRAAAGHARARPTAPMRTRPLANTSPSGPAISTASSGLERCPSPSSRRPGAATCPARAGPAGRRRRPRPCRSSPTAKRDPELAGRQPPRRGAARRCRRRARRRRPASSTPRRDAAAITVRTPDQAAILAAASFDAMPPLPRAEPAPPASASSAWSTSTISSMSDADGVEAGVGGEQPGRVGEQHEQVGVEEVGDQRGEAVVVAEADLVVGDGVVLVDDRHHAELEQPAERAPGVEVLLADDEVERGEQHLARDEAVGGEGARRRPA